MTEAVDRALALAIRIADDVVDRVQEEFSGDAQQNASAMLVFGYLLGVLDIMMVADQKLNPRALATSFAHTGRALGRNHATLRQQAVTPKGNI